jgi:hypothetical protein
MSHNYGPSRALLTQLSSFSGNATSFSATPEISSPS